MADKIRTRRSKPAIPYSSLHSLWAIHSIKEKKKPPKATGKYYEVERVIDRRNGQQTKEYLIKWAGYPLWQSTWEPEENLNKVILRSYDHHQPELERIDRCCFSFMSNVQNGLKSSGIDTHVYVPFDLDVWRYLSRGKGSAANKKGWFLFEKEDFERFSCLPKHWYYFLNEHGEGKAIDFPIKLRPFLGQSSHKNFIVGDKEEINKAPIYYQEKLTIYFVKRACNASNV